MLNRKTDVVPTPNREELPPLPAVDWHRVGQRAPAPLPLGPVQPDAPLPRADVVVMTWTSAEWSALDHVFVNSSQARKRDDRSWEKDWQLYSKGAPRSTFPLWGYHRCVSIKPADHKELKVLLFKSETHLAHSPYGGGLIQLVDSILADTHAQHLYSIGTAGGATLSERLGDVAVTNAGKAQFHLAENSKLPVNGETVECKGWYPSLELMSAVQRELMFPMSRVVTQQELAYLTYQLHQHNKDAAPFGVEDFVNAALEPRNLHSPKGIDKRGVPLLSTDYYFIASGNDAKAYCALEMDDAAVGYAAGKRGVSYAFVRNISDPVVPVEAASGITIPDAVRGDWSSAIYSNFGLYTSFNGALLTWATLAAGRATKGG